MILNGMLFASWLGLGTAIELLGYHLGAYRFVHWTLPFVVAGLLFGLAAPLLQRLLSGRPLAFAVLIFASAAAIEFGNARWLHWWAFSEKIRAGFASDWALALGTSAPLLPIAWLMSVGFAGPAPAPPAWSDLRDRLGLVPLRPLLLHGAICVVLLIALGRFGNAEYLLKPFGFGYLASIAPLEPRTASPPLAAGTALFVFLLQGALALIALLLAARSSGLPLGDLGFQSGRLGPRQGLPLLLFLTLAPLPSFIMAGLDPAMSTNYPFVPDFATVWSFVTYEFGYGIFFLVVESVFRVFLFMGFALLLIGRGSGAAAAPAIPLLAAGMLSCLCYVVWHLGKPVPELFGAVLWGPIACAIIWKTRSILYLALPHWLWNVVLDVFVTAKRFSLLAS